MGAWRRRRRRRRRMEHLRSLWEWEVWTFQTSILLKLPVYAKEELAGLQEEMCILLSPRHCPPLTAWKEGVVVERSLRREGTEACIAQTMVVKDEGGKGTRPALRAANPEGDALML